MAGFLYLTGALSLALGALFFFAGLGIGMTGLDVLAGVILGIGGIGLLGLGSVVDALRKIEVHLSEEPPQEID